MHAVQINPDAWYDLGATYRTLGDGALVKGCPADALMYWEKAYKSLSTLLGQVPEVQRLQGRLKYHGSGKGNVSEMAEAVALMQCI